MIREKLLHRLQSAEHIGSGLPQQRKGRFRLPANGAFHCCTDTGGFFALPVQFVSGIAQYRTTDVYGQPQAPVLFPRSKNRL